MDRASIALIVAAVIDIPLFILIGKIFFGCWSDFWDAIVFWITPDMLSMLTGEYWDDLWAELKLGLFVVTCGACLWGELLLIAKLFGQTAAA